MFWTNLLEESRPYSRREIISAVGAGTAAGLAGCQSFNPDTPAADPTPSDATATETATEKTTTTTPEPEPAIQPVKPVTGKRKDIRSKMPADNLGQPTGEDLFLYQYSENTGNAAEVAVDHPSMQWMQKHEYETIRGERKIADQVYKALTREGTFELAKSGGFNGNGADAEPFSMNKFRNSEDSLQALQMAQTLSFNIERVNNNRSPNSTRAEAYQIASQSGINDTRTEKTSEQTVNIASVDISPVGEKDELVFHGMNYAHLNDLDELHAVETRPISSNYSKQMIAPIEESNYSNPDHKAGQYLYVPTELGLVDKPGKEIADVPENTSKEREKKNVATLFQGFNTEYGLDAIETNMFDRDNLAFGDNIVSEMAYSLHTYNMEENNYSMEKHIEPAAEMLNSLQVDKNHSYAIFRDHEYDGEGYGFNIHQISDKVENTDELLNQVWNGNIETPDQLYNQARTAA